jgi:hypothetical protein
MLLFDFLGYFEFVVNLCFCASTCKSAGDKYERREEMDEIRKVYVAMVY